MNRPKVSIIVPVYNVEKYLSQCIESILNQTLKEIEIILINDGSKDCSGDICDNYACKDSRIKVIHKENGGQSSARNRGILESTGEYIGFVDSDDYIDEDMYESMYKKAIEQNCDIVICKLKQDISNRNYNYFYPEYKKMHRDYIQTEFLSYLVTGINETFVTNKIYKKSLLVDSNIMFRKSCIWEDKIFNLEIFPYINSIYFIPEYFYTYRVVFGSMVRAYHPNKFDIILKINKLQLNLINLCKVKNYDVINKQQRCFMHNSLVFILEQYCITNYKARLANYKKIMNDKDFKNLIFIKSDLLKKERMIIRLLEFFLKREVFFIVDCIVLSYGFTFDFLRKLKRKILRRS